MRGDVGLAALPPDPPAGPKLVKAKLILPVSPLLEVELMEALLPWRPCRAAAFGSAGGTLTIVRRLDDDLEGFRLTATWLPHGSLAEIEPLRADTRRGPNEGLWEGDPYVSILTVLDDVYSMKVGCLLMAFEQPHSAAVSSTLTYLKALG